jgi:hypothetical protein
VGAVWTYLSGLPQVIAALAAAALATAGWLYAARRQRALSRKQHTFNALLQTSFNAQYQAALVAIGKYLAAGKLPALDADEHADLRKNVVFLLNHYEFLSAGIRNGDISERLLRDSEKSTILRLFAVSEPFIVSLRDLRRRPSAYEHIEWLCDRWEHKPPARIQWTMEMIRGRAYYHSRYAWYTGIVWAIIIAAVLVAAYYLPHGTVPVTAKKP